jgi:ribosomal protein S18 acetylase RimI-like enzyme
MNNLQFIQFDLLMLQECIDLYQQVFSKEPWNENSNRDDVERYFLNMYYNNKFIGYVIKSSEKIIALSIGFLKPWIKGEEYYIDQFCVDYNYQGQGVGSYFINEIKKDLMGKDIHAMILTTERKFPSYHFYIKNGFSSLDDLCFMGTEF